MNTVYNISDLDIPDIINNVIMLNDCPVSIFVNELVEDNNSFHIRNIWGNNMFYHNLNYSSQELEDIDIRFIDEFIHPEDRIIVYDTLDSLKKYIFNTIFFGILRIKTKDESYNWFHIITWKLKEDKDSPNILTLGLGFKLSKSIFSENQIFDFAKQLIQHKSTIELKSITKREKQVLKFIAKGLTNYEIGKTLNISNKTAETHRKNIQRKLNLHNTAALVNYATENGLN